MAAVSRTTVEETKPNLLSPKSKGKGTCTTPVPKRDVLRKRSKTGNDQSPECATILMSNLSQADNAKDILCRNVTIYGKCRYEDKGTVTTSEVMMVILMLARMRIQSQSGKACKCFVRKWRDGDRQVGLHSVF